MPTNTAHGRRVQMYFPPPPPPLAAVPQKRHETPRSRFRPLLPRFAPDTRDIFSSSGIPHSTGQPARTFPTAGYPSPGPSRSSPPLSSPVYRGVHATQSQSRIPDQASQAISEASSIKIKTDDDLADSDLFAYRPLSPPASDPVSPPFHELELKMPVNVPRIRRNVTSTKRYLAKVFLASCTWF
ncbi:hypothetical protein CVT24_011465 [Panaeolus cyanescens]|uniref:Uncharacterized protein n=1 Tax=Panaeolus cyanescens TaxID=181874 RepID=A0A409YGU0_9AGAR|nr:hypothetical protein CVT24_011465 [Panaeolus cyanescens]